MIGGVNDDRQLCRIGVNDGARALDRGQEVPERRDAQFISMAIYLKSSLVTGIYCAQTK
jgi:hypothetical protein